LNLGRSSRNLGKDGIQKNLEWCKMAENGYHFGKKKSNKCKLKDSTTIALR
jgi:hypothetical protein